MSVVALDELANEQETPEETGPPGTWRSAVRSPAIWCLVVLVALAGLAPIIAPYGGTQIIPGALLKAPSIHHLFGTDSNSMDVLSRVLIGARKDLLLSLAATVISAVIGSALGLVAAYYGRWFDPVLQRVNEVILAFPVVLFAMAVLVAVGPSLLNLTLVIAFVNIPIYFRIIRSVVLPMRHAEFVDAARASGNSVPSILGRHLLPNLWAPIIAQLTVNFAWAIQILAGLSFLGLGVHLPEPEWGLMVQQGSNYVISGQWWIAFFPGLAIFIAVLTLTRVGAFVERAGASGEPASRDRRPRSGPRGGCTSDARASWRAPRGRGRRGRGTGR